MSLIDSTLDRVLSDQSKRVLESAEQEALSFNHTYVGTEHILLGLLRPTSLAQKVLYSKRVDRPKTRSTIEFIIGRGDVLQLEPLSFTPRGKKVMSRAVDEAHRLNALQVRPEHILLGLLREGEGVAAGVLESLGVGLETTRRQLLDRIAAESTLEGIVEQQMPELEKVVELIPVYAVLKAEHGEVPWRAALLPFFRDNPLLSGLLEKDDTLAAVRIVVQNQVLAPHFKRYGTCPPLEEIYDMATGDKRLTLHVSRCPYCRSKLTSDLLNLPTDIALGTRVSSQREAILVPLRKQINDDLRRHRRHGQRANLPMPASSSPQVT